jgi:hypothetical protein
VRFLCKIGRSNFCLWSFFWDRKYRHLTPIPCTRKFTMHCSMKCFQTAFERAPSQSKIKIKNEVLEKHEGTQTVRRCVDVNDSGSEISSKIQAMIKKNCTEFLHLSKSSDSLTKKSSKHRALLCKYSSTNTSSVPNEVKPNLNSAFSQGYPGSSRSFCVCVRSPTETSKMHLIAMFPSKNILIPDITS